MNPGLPTRASVKSSGISQTLDLTTTVPISPLITWFEVIGYTVLLDSPTVNRQHQIEHSNQTEVLLPVRLCSALQRINPRLSSEAIAQAIRQVTSLESLNLLSNNHHFHKLLTTGVDVAYQFNGQTVRENVSLVDLSNLLNNDWLVINPFTVVKGNCTHSLDVVVFVNGLPLAVMVWTHPQDENATLKAAYQRLQTYLQKIPQLFIYNAFLIIACGNRARVGTLTSDWQEFLPWQVIRIS
ncbi:type I restriction endonuclease [Cylindrospermum stagnale]|uniref:type I restriction endonuclease n=1 Tax=Cylindrospermum stagnale TaxID=142864 RepID=UPI00031990F7|nr:type I restriction endonuclease [Cylindrospermum stagnale]